MKSEVKMANEAETGNEDEFTVHIYFHTNDSVHGLLYTFHLSKAESHEEASRSNFNPDTISLVYPLGANIPSTSHYQPWCLGYCTQKFFLVLC